MTEKRRKNKRGGKIFVFSGPSGSGKTTLRDLIIKDPAFSRKFMKSVSFTTRTRRKGEKEGVDYNFITKDEFLRLNKAGKILEWTKYLENYYGTSRDFISQSLKNGKSIILCLDFKGFLNVKRFYKKKAVGIFVLPPSIKELRKRIVKRSLGTLENELGKRLSLAVKEIKNAPKYDYAFRNINLNNSVNRLKGIILKIL